MGLVWRVCGLALGLLCLTQTSAGLDWRARLLAAERDALQPPDPLTQLLRELDVPHPCTNDTDCCNNDGEPLCECAGFQCLCYGNAYWQTKAAACVRKGELNENCTFDSDACYPSHSSCQNRNGRLLCECDYPGYYEDNSGQNCIPAGSPFFTTTIIVAICILFAAVAIGVVMQIRSNMQRRMFQRQYRQHANLDAMLAAQRRARQRRAAQRRANPTRRYSDEAAPDEPPPPYVPIFTTRSSGDWGKLPSYQEAVANATDRDNEAFEMEEGVFTGTEEAPPAGADLPAVETAPPPARTVAAEDRCQPASVGGDGPAVGEESSEPTAPADAAVSPRHHPQLTGSQLGTESLLRRTGSI